MHDCHQGGTTVDRECEGPEGSVKYLSKVCQLIGRWYGQGEDVRRLWGDVTVVRKCGSSKGGVTIIKRDCQLMGRCDGHGGM